MDEEDLLKKKTKKPEESKVEIPVVKAYELLREMSYNYDDLEVVPKKKQNKLKTFLSKKSYKYGMGFAVLLLAVFGVSYSYFNYTKIDSRQADIAAGEVYVRLVENATSITLPKMYPRTDEEARSRNDNYFDFTIKGKNTSETRSILYTINIENGEVVSGKTRIDPQYIKIDLQEKVGQDYNYIAEGVKLSDFSFTDAMLSNTISEMTKEYRLRFWISDDVTISDTDQNATYTETQFNNLFATYSVSVTSEDKVIIYDKIIKNLSQSYVASYQDVIDDNPGLNFTTHDQVSDNASKKTVYYYTGNEAAANSNVLFAGYCWQIVRTTDNGGVRMIYNGVAQKPVTASTPISNADITYTNDSTYAYTYDSNTKKWTSANAGVASTTDTFIFSVNTAGDYAINYKVSSQANGDYAKIYIKPTGGSFVLQTQYSGEVEGTFDLGTLGATDEIKIEYTKNASTNTGNDNIIFDIASVNTRGDTPVCAQDRRITGIKGINAVGNGTTQSMSAATRYGRSFDYDLATGEFTLQETNNLPTAWTTSDNNSNGTEDYKELIGTYTCLSNLDTCTTLYYVGSINQSNTAQAYVSKYTIGDVAHYSQMGTSAFNSNYISPAMVGYMFNTEYDYKSGSKSGEYYTTATWNGTTYDLTSSNNGSAPDVEHHYICDTDCTKVRYYYYVSGSSHYYILLENGMTIEDAIYKMTGNGTVETKSKTINANYELNNYNSAMKGYLDNWYKKNLTGYTSFLDGTSVYCNDRSIRELGGWNPTNSPSLTTTLQFYQYSANRDLNCVNETDRFAVTNNKAELTYPIGLLTEPERNLMTANFAKTGQYYWGASPDSFDGSSARVRFVSAAGGISISHVYASYGARGVVSLRPGTKLEKGTGTYNDPYIVGPIVSRTS